MGDFYFYDLRLVMSYPADVNSTSLYVPPKQISLSSLLCRDSLSSDLIENEDSDYLSFYSLSY